MIFETVMLAQREIRRNVLRSSLTVLGIVIGVAAVITMVTLGSGATAQVTDDISKLGSNMLQVRPGQGHRGPGGARNASDPFEVKDAEAIEREISGLEAVAPAANGASQAIYGNENWGTTVTGTTNGYVEVQGLGFVIRSIVYRQRAKWRAGGLHSWSHGAQGTFRRAGPYWRKYPLGENYL
jgi:putative ABC transport system permease protein